jgi:hypothetical protein
MQRAKATEVDILDATVELYTLLRDSSKTVAGQISWQKRIVDTARQKEASLQQQRSSGSVGITEVLRAKEQVFHGTKATGTRGQEIIGSYRCLEGQAARSVRPRYPSRHRRHTF